MSREGCKEQRRGSVYIKKKRKERQRMARDYPTRGDKKTRPVAADVMAHFQWLLGPCVRVWTWAFLTLDQSHHLSVFSAAFFTQLDEKQLNKPDSSGLNWQDKMMPPGN